MDSTTPATSKCPVSKPFMVIICLIVIGALGAYMYISNQSNPELPSLATKPKVQQNQAAKPTAPANPQPAATTTGN